MELRCNNCGSVDLRVIGHNLFECNFCHTQYIPDKDNSSNINNSSIIRNDADRKRLIKNARAFYTNKDFGKAKIVFDELLMHYPIYIYEDVAKEYYIYRKSLIIYKLNDNMISFFDKWEFIKEGILLMDNLKKHNIDIDDLKNELEKIYFILNYKDIGEKCSFYIDDETQSFNKAESINRTSASEYDKYGYIKLWQNKEIVGNYALQLQNIKENMNNQMPPKTFMKEHKRKVGSIKAELYSFIIMILLTPLLPILMFYFVKCYTERAVDKHPKIW